MDNDLDMLKALWNMVLHSDAPAEYPVMPTMLIDTHPGVYIRTHARDAQPIRPPVPKSIHSLNILKTTTGCRNTKTNWFPDPCNMMLQRHHLALEAMLVLGKLCPPRRPGELYYSPSECMRRG